MYIAYTYAFNYAVSWFRMICRRVKCAAAVNTRRAWPITSCQNTLILLCKYTHYVL